MCVDWFLWKNLCSKPIVDCVSLTFVNTTIFVRNAQAKPTWHKNRVYCFFSKNTSHNSNCLWQNYVKRFLILKSAVYLFNMFDYSVSQWSMTAQLQAKNCTGSSNSWTFCARYTWICFDSLLGTVVGWHSFPLPWSIPLGNPWLLDLLKCKWQMAVHWVTSVVWPPLPAIPMTYSQIILLHHLLSSARGQHVVQKFESIKSKSCGSSGTLIAILFKNPITAVRPHLLCY